MTGSVTFPVELGGDGSTVTDDDSSTTGLRNGGYRTRFVPALQQTVAIASQVATTAATVASNATAASAAAASVVAAGSVGPLVSGTSSTSLTIGTGSKTLTTQSGKAWSVGARLRIADSGATNLMDGEVTAYSGTSLTVSVDRTEGSGTISSWNITYVGPAGPATLSYLQEGQSTSSPNATVYVSRLSATGAATNIDAAFIPKGSGAVLAAVPDSTSTGGNKRGANAVDWQSSRNNAAHVASGISSIIAGGNYNTASGNYSAVIYGDSNTASGLHAVAGGYGTTASGEHAMAIGYTHTASGKYSTVLGGLYGTDRGIAGAVVFPSAANAAATPSAQSSTYTLYRQTSDATPSRLTTTGAGAGAANNINLPDSSAYHCRVRILALRSSDNTAKSWTGDVLIRRAVGAAGTAVVGSPSLASDFGDAGLSSLAVAVAADTTNGGLSLTVTGLAGTTITWAARVDCIEVDI